jgi:hypothetical protein
MRLAAIFSAILWLTACAQSNTSSGSDAGLDAPTDAAGSEDTFVEPTFPDLPKGWSVIETGGETICSRGSKYLFLVRKGTVNRIVIDFMGGGACWNEQTCSFADSIFNENLDLFENAGGDVDLDGIYDSSDQANPFKDWYHIVVPYCTGDIHWGNSVVDYGQAAGTIHHKGAVNTRAVLDWIDDQFAAPEKIFVTGCSAGAYGSIGWAPHIIEQFPTAKITQMGDSGVGIITENFFKDSFPKWNAWEMMPGWIDALNLTQEELFELGLEDVYIRVAAHYPDLTFSQFTTAFDQTQVIYYQAMGGGSAQEWSEKMMLSIDKAKENSPNFRSYIGPGNQHCIVPYANFYTMESAETVFSDWVTDIVNDEPVEHVQCDPCD